MEKKRVIKAVILIGSLLALGMTAIAAGAIYEYNKAESEHEGGRSVAFFVTAFASCTLICFTLFMCMDISCKVRSSYEIQTLELA